MRSDEILVELRILAAAHASQTRPQANGIAGVERGGNTLQRPAETSPLPATQEGGTQEQQTAASFERIIRSSSRLPRSHPAVGMHADGVKNGASFEGEDSIPQTNGPQAASTLPGLTLVDQQHSQLGSVSQPASHNALGQRNDAAVSQLGVGAHRGKRPTSATSSQEAPAKRRGVGQGLTPDPAPTVQPAEIGTSGPPAGAVALKPTQGLKETTPGPCESAYTLPPGPEGASAGPVTPGALGGVSAGAGKGSEKGSGKEAVSGAMGGESGQGVGGVLTAAEKGKGKAIASIAGEIAGARIGGAGWSAGSSGKGAGVGASMYQSELWLKKLKDLPRLRTNTANISMVRAC